MSNYQHDFGKTPYQEIHAYPPSPAGGLAPSSFAASPNGQGSNNYAYHAGGYVSSGYAQMDNPKFSSKRSKWKTGGCCLFILAILGAAAGVVLWKFRWWETTESETWDFIPGTARVVKTNAKDTSQFEKNSRLHQSFYGLGYTPYGVIDSNNCGITLANVTEDIQLISQLTRRVRIYTSQCLLSEYTLRAIQDTKVDLQVWLTANLTGNTLHDTSEFAFLLNSIDSLGVNQVGGIIIGNHLVSNSAAPDKQTAANTIVTGINEMRSNITARTLGKVIPVGTSELSREITPSITTASDFVFVTADPFGAGIAPSVATNWIVSNTTISSNLTLFYSEAMGWPTSSIDSVGAATVGLPSLQEFLNRYACSSGNSFYSDVFDTQSPQSEGLRGLGDMNRVWKNVTFPTC